MRWGLFAIYMIVPWAATFLGSLTALVIKLDSKKRQGVMLGFAAGVMIAASVWSLILPAFDEVGNNLSGMLIVTLGFVVGCAGMLALDKIVPHQHNKMDAPEGRSSHLSRPMLLAAAVALHNIPEGIALGVVIAAANSGASTGWSAALVFAFGLALQNFPEGLAVTFPLYQSGVSKRRCAQLGLLTSLSEPVAALLGLVSTSLLSMLGNVVMPILLSVAAGAMIFIVVEELIPESQIEQNGHSATYGFLLGFWVMALAGLLFG